VRVLHWRSEKNKAGDVMELDVTDPANISWQELLGKASSCTHNNITDVRKARPTMTESKVQPPANIGRPVGTI
jgi:hypothetical protein